MERGWTEARPLGTTRTNDVRVVMFALFFCSGFCSLLYQVVWVRLAFSHFGVITPVLSCVLSVFMLGLGIGSLAGGAGARWWQQSLGLSVAYLYAAIEAVVGLGAFMVPRIFEAGDYYLLRSGEVASSTSYFLASGLLIFVAILPWCIMMGATLPVMMAFIRNLEPGGEKSFSFLYLANVMGAMSGTIVSALVLIELFGFWGTSMIAATINFLIAAVSALLGRLSAFDHRASSRAHTPAPAQPQPDRRGRLAWSQVILFTTGLTALAMEVVWTRAFTFVLKTTIYSFAAILATYLLATWIGSYLYRRALSHRGTDGRLLSTHQVLGSLGVFALLPLVLDDPRLNDGMALGGIAVTLAGIVPFCLALGYLTPRLVDDYARGSPSGAGWAYGVNIAGGILGPLLAACVLLPVIGNRGALLVLSLPLFGLFAWSLRHSASPSRARIAISSAFVALFAFASLVSRGYEDGIFYSGPHQTRRDATATVVAFGEGMNRRLLVNGVGMTFLTPITKVMAHLPLATHNGPQTGLVICFGMGTTFRSMRSWGIDTTVVELSRSVVDSFGFFFPDSKEIVSDPMAHIIIDDGRRYLSRTDRSFDVITLDPPPPIEAAASSLLYSKEFYEVVKMRLAPQGILQQWFPGGESKIQYAVAASLRESFPYVVAFRSIEDWGYHFLASMSPIDEITPAELLERLPERAKRDLMEWNPEMSIDKMAQNILERRTDVDRLLSPHGGAAIVTDDRPYNEYFFLRRQGLTN